LQKVKRCAGLPVAGSVDRLLGHHAEPLSVADEEVLAVAVARKPALELLRRRVHFGLADRQLLQVGFEIDQEEHNHRQAQHRQCHGA
jgi:hypothetical protein